MSTDAEPSRCPRVAVVGIGASAGGLEALRSVLDHIDPNVAASFVVVTHGADHAAALRELLSSQSRVRWLELRAAAQLHAGLLYLVPAGKALQFTGDRLELCELEGPRATSAIDGLFRSLAQLGERAVAVVLSGDACDGCLGIKDLKAAGGAVLVQAPHTARFPTAPQRALESVLVDQVLHPEDIGPSLLRLLERRSDPAAGAAPPAHASFVTCVLERLRTATGHDFTPYKRATLVRRIERRMQLLAVDTPDDYLDLLEEQPNELEQLWSELLIGVTRFFRDPEAFAALELALSRYLAQRDNADELRVWVPACSTGEEAYSVAIVVHEALERAGKPAAAQVFATDIDPRAVHSARAGRFTRAAAADIGHERLARYFVPDGDALRACHELRDLLVFAPQNLAHDPPFTRVDLLVCRNLLTYLEPELQQKLLALFHYALVPRGLLFLGSSESLGAQAASFATLDQRWKLFENRAAPRPAYAPELRLRAGGRSPQAHEAARLRVAAPPPGPTHAVADRLLLENLVPPCVLIDARGDISYIHGRTGRFLEPAAGEPRPNVFDMARDGLRLELAAAVREAELQQRAVYRRALAARTEAGDELVDISVVPLASPDPLDATGLMAVTFELCPEAACSDAQPSPAGALCTQEPAPRTIQRELQQMRETLHITMAELETTHHELKSTNDQLRAIHEELQSTHEELEANRQQLQSLNEELQTLDRALHDRNEELSRCHDDMRNLLGSAEVAALFLDRELNIKRLTGPAKALFDVRESDLGRSIDDLVANLRYEALRADAEKVLESLVFTERAVQTAQGDWRQVRIVPYRTAQDMIDGLVITVLQVDREKQAELRAERLRAFCERVLDTLGTGLLFVDDQLVVRRVNAAFCEMFDLSPRRVLGESLHVLSNDWGQPALNRHVAQLTSGEPFAPLHLRGALSAKGSKDLRVTARDLADAALDGRYLLMLEDITQPALPVRSPG